MEQFNELSVINRIEELRVSKNWSYYKLAKRSNITLSTLFSMIRTPHIPTIHTLAKICNGFGISLSSFFYYLNDSSDISTGNFLDVLPLWETLDSESKHLALNYMKGLAQKPTGGK